MSNSTQNIKEWAGDPMYPRNSTQNDMEKRFVTWALARDDDWWQEGHGAVSIWDVRIMLDFMVKELADARKEMISKVESLPQYWDLDGDRLCVKRSDVLATLREELTVDDDCNCSCTACGDCAGKSV